MSQQPPNGQPQWGQQLPPYQQQPGQFQKPPYNNYPPPRRQSGTWQWYKSRTRKVKLSIGCGTILALLLLFSCIGTAVGSINFATQSTPTPTTSNNQAAILVSPSATPTPAPTPTSTPSPTPTPTPTLSPALTMTPMLSPALQRVIDDNALTPGIDFPDGKVSDGINTGVLWILEDLGSRSKYPLAVSDIHFGCFMEFEAIYVPSPRLTAVAPPGITEVDIRFTFGGHSIGSCRLTSKTAASIPWFDKNGVGIDVDAAWKLYDGTSIEV